MMESFIPILNYFMQEKNIENTQFLTLSIHTFPIINLERLLHHSDFPIDIENYYISFSSWVLLISLNSSK